MSELVPLRTGEATAAGLVPFRVRKIGPDVLLTNPWGDWVFVKIGRAHV